MTTHQTSSALPPFYVDVEVFARRMPLIRETNVFSCLRPQRQDDEAIFIYVKHDKKNIRLSNKGIYVDTNPSNSIVRALFSPSSNVKLDQIMRVKTHSLLAFFEANDFEPDPTLEPTYRVRVLNSDHLPVAQPTNHTAQLQACVTKIISQKCFPTLIDDLQTELSRDISRAAFEAYSSSFTPRLNWVKDPTPFF